MSLRTLALDTSWGSLTVVGGSRAGEGTLVLLPQLRLALDAGRPHRALAPMSTVLVSHGHMDHIGGLGYWASQRYLNSMGPGTVMAPAEIADDVKALLETMARLEGGRPYDVDDHSGGCRRPASSARRLRARLLRHRPLGADPGLPRHLAHPSPAGRARRPQRRGDRAPPAGRPAGHRGAPGRAARLLRRQRPRPVRELPRRARRRGRASSSARSSGRATATAPFATATCTSTTCSRSQSAWRAATSCCCTPRGASGCARSNASSTSSCEPRLPCALHHLMVDWE